MTRLNWHRKRAAPRPLVTREEKLEFERQAKVLAERLKKGHRNPQAHLHGPVRKWTPEEIAAYEATRKK